MTIPLALTVVTSLAGGALLAAVARRWKGTTLWAPCLWACLSWATLLLAVLTGRLLGAHGTGAVAGSGGALFFMAAVSTYCPFVAILGAKQPQSRPWQLIVLALWGVLSLPAVEALLFGYGGDVAPGPARSWFMLALSLLGLANYVFTRYAVAAVAFCLGQAVLLAGHLPGVPPAGFETRTTAGPILFFAGMVLAAVCRPSRGATGSPWEKAWLDVRDAYGAAWALRLARRFNAKAESSGWPVRIAWGGLVDRGGRRGVPAPDLSNTDAGEALVALLRRFVSRHWLAERGLGEPAIEPTRGASAG